MPKPRPKSCATSCFKPAARARRLPSPRHPLPTPRRPPRLPSRPRRRRIPRARMARLRSRRGNRTGTFLAGVPKASPLQGAERILRMTGQTALALLLVTFAFPILAHRALADGPKDNSPDHVRTIPPLPTSELTPEERADLEAGVKKLGDEISSLR